MGTKQRDPIQWENNFTLLLRAAEQDWNFTHHQREKEELRKFSSPVLQTPYLKITVIKKKKKSCIQWWSKHWQTGTVDRPGALNFKSISKTSFAMFKVVKIVIAIKIYLVFYISPKWVPQVLRCTSEFPWQKIASCARLNWHPGLTSSQFSNWSYKPHRPRYMLLRKSLHGTEAHDGESHKHSDQKKREYCLPWCGLISSARGIFKHSFTWIHVIMLHHIFFFKTLATSFFTQMMALQIKTDYTSTEDVCGNQSYRKTHG